jgi:putative serine protease PepD
MEDTPVNDAREPGPDSAGPDVPPPSPWWSRPDDEWGAPQDQSAPGPQPAYGSTPYGTQPTTPPPADDPWSRPTTRATFPSGAQAWGYPTDTIGSPVPPPEKKPRRGLGTAAAVLVTALVAGSVGGIVGARSGGGDDLLDSGASLGGGGSTTATVDRAPDSVAGIAARVMQSTVSIAVRGGGGNGTGSGVVIRSDGYILTNNHVVETAPTAARSP